MLVLLLVPNVDSIQVTRSYHHTDPFHDILIDNFGLAVGGLVEIEYKVTPSSRDMLYGGEVVVLLVTNAQRIIWYDGSSTSTMCSQPSMFRRELRGKGREMVVISPDITRDRFSIFLLQCRDSQDPVEISVTATMRNPRPNSSTEYSHKPIGDVAVLQLLEGKIIALSLLALGMLGQLYFCRSVQHC